MDYVENMAWANDTAKPWHGNGNAVSPDSSLEQWADEGGIDGPIVKRRMYCKLTPDGPAVLPVGNFANAEAEKRGEGAIWAVWRKPYKGDNWRFYSTVSSDYNPTQGIEILRFFKEAADRMEVTIETVGSLKKGAVIWALARINHGADFKLKGEDWIKGYVLITTSHDGSVKFTAFTTAVRVVCWNTFRMAFGDKKRQDVLFAMKHNNSNREAILKAAQGKLEQAIANMQGIKEQAELLASVPVSQDTVNEIVYRLTSKDGTSLLETATEITEATQAATATGNYLDLAVANTEVVQEVNKVKLYTADKMNEVGKLYLDAIMTSPGSDMGDGLNLWKVYNGITYTEDHLRGYKKDRGIPNGNRFYNATFGGGADAKDAALNLCLDYAKSA